MKSRAVAVSVAGLAAAILGLNAAQSPALHQQPFVVGLVGVWQQPSNENPKKLVDLRFLQPLEAGEGTCAYGMNGYVAVQFDDKVVPFQCTAKSDGNCNVANALKKDGSPYACARRLTRPPEQSIRAQFWAAFAAAVTPLLRRDADRYVAPVSRGLDPELSDGVVASRGNGADFAPAFADLEDGSYAIRLEPLQAGPKALEANISWRAGGVAMITVAPGLYRVTRLASGASSGQDAWVLVSGAAQFEKRSADYKRVLDATRRWPSEADARAPKAILRAYLQAMANEGQ